MRKFFILLAAAFVTIAAGAKVLRVSNVTGSSAPYSTLVDAIAAAADGDTIMVDGSTTDYDAATIDKKLVVVGPGYWLVENGITQNGDAPAAIKETLSIAAEGVVIKGLYLKGNLKILGAKATVARCKLDKGINIDASASFPTITQNYITGEMIGMIKRDVQSEYYCSYALVTNNIFSGAYYGCVSFFQESSFLYNTFVGGNTHVENCKQCYFSNNFMKNDFYYCKSTTVTDNGIWDGSNGNPFSGCETDTDVRVKQEAHPSADGNVGAWAGNTPYIISGVPVGPVIESVKMPVSVEQGKQLPVTVTIKVQQ